MLRSTESVLHMLEGAKGLLQRLEIEFGFEREVIERCLHFDSFQAHISADRSEQMRDLAGQALERGLAQGSILLERFVILFDVAVATHKTVDLVFRTQVFKLKRQMRRQSKPPVSSAGPALQAEAEVKDETVTNPPAAGTSRNLSTRAPAAGAQPSTRT